MGKMEDEWARWRINGQDGEDKRGRGEITGGEYNTDSQTYR